MSHLLLRISEADLAYSHISRDWLMNISRQLGGCSWRRIQVLHIAASLRSSSHRLSRSCAVCKPVVRQGYFRNASSCVRPISADQHSSTSYIAATVGVSVGILYLVYQYTSETASSPSNERLAHRTPPVGPAVDIMAGKINYSEIPIDAGHAGNLTIEQEQKLRELWAALFVTVGVEVKPKKEEIEALPTAGEPATPKKKRTGLFSRKGNDSPKPDEDKYGLGKIYKETLEKNTPEDLRKLLWQFVKHDNPDVLLLRFLRARKWDVEKALVMLIATVNWRGHEMLVDEEIMLKGESHFASIEKGEGKDSSFARDFLLQLRTGKSFIHGYDNSGRPVAIMRARLHRAGEADEKALERVTVHLIETCRLMLRPPVETATLLFDMSDFSLANMDYAPVKFMIQCFEAHYPESLGYCIVHRAPWVFQGIWAIVKGWLDPVVASKVHFTKTIEELEALIPRSRILKELGGDDPYKFTYLEPVPGEDDLMKDTEKRDAIQKDRAELSKEFEDVTKEWVESGAVLTDDLRTRRSKVIDELQKNYWLLDPYVRSRSMYDRMGIIVGGGEIDFYPEASKQE